ncbi:hypothetical protein ACFL3S_02690 [Gemmatimonadota bacterium]
MKKAMASVRLVLLAVVGLGWGCKQGPETWSPVLEKTSTAFLETETERAREEVGEALNKLHSDPAGAEAALRRTARSLDYLKDFYLPLFQAREQAYNAFRFFRLGEHGHVVRELEAIESTLVSMVQAAGGGPLEELQALAEATADARVAVEADPDESVAALENLARKLDQALLKGDLILR